MSRFSLRQRPPISYFEPEEPSFDEYVYCDECADYVFEYCAIHGPLLGIPDDKVPAKHKFPSYVPRAALTIPHVFLHLNHSTIPGAGLGVFTTLAMPRGVRFGPYRGVRSQGAGSDYCWQIYDRNNKPLHLIDAVDADKSNWMRYVNCSRYWQEQNLLAYQYQGELYYRTVKTIPPFTELLIFYGSEFANYLGIDLKKYNSPTAYAQQFGAPAPKKLRLETQKEKLQDETAEEINSDIVTESTTIKKKKVQCPECSNVYSRRIYMMNHFRHVHVKASRFYCEDCDKHFLNRTRYRDHRRYNHEGFVKEKDKLCNICGRGFAENRTLTNHMRTHSGERPYVCSYCDSKFRQKQALQSHVKFIHLKCRRKNPSFIIPE